MPTSKKIFTVQNLTQKVKDAKALFLADYRGLTVEQMASLREQVKKVGGELEVVKNRLLKLAFENVQFPISNDQLKGPTAVLWAWEDEIRSIKALHDFALQTGLPKIKFGLFGGKEITLERIKELASLPTKDELKVRLVRTLQSPAFGLTNALNWNLKKLIYVLKAKGGEESGKKRKAS